MKQRYHSNATTNIHLRSEINKSTKSNIELSVQYGVSEKTIVKWKAREKFTDKSSRPNTITYALTHFTSSFLRFSGATVIFIAFCSNEYNNYFI